jgi:hypothetical protein
MASLNKNKRYEIINKYNVAIASLRNKILQTNGIDELTLLASKIIEMEQQILIEKTAGYKELEKEKKTLENKLDKAKREIQRMEHDKTIINNKINVKINGYKKTLESKIADLSNDYNTLLENMDKN